METLDQCLGRKVLVLEEASNLSSNKFSKNKNFHIWLCILFDNKSVFEILNITVYSKSDWTHDHEFRAFFEGTRKVWSKFKIISSTFASLPFKLSET